MEKPRPFLRTRASLVIVFFFGASFDFFVSVRDSKQFVVMGVSNEDRA
jgi:hypothetical protein